MGAAVPIIGAVTGGIGAISQINAQRKQAKAQKGALKEQERVTKETARLRLEELNRQEQMAKFQRVIDQLQNTMVYNQQRQQIAEANLNDAMETQKASFQNAQTLLQTLGEAEDTRQSGKTASFEAGQRASEMVANSSQQSSTEAQQRQQGGLEFDKGLTDAERQRAVLQGLVAAALGTNLNASATGQAIQDAQDAALAKDVQKLVQGQGLAEDLDNEQMDYVSDIANLTARGGGLVAERADTAANNQQELSRRFAQANADDNYIQRERNFNALQGQHGAANLARGRGLFEEALNEKYQDAAFANQREMIEKTSQSDVRMLQTQRSGIASPGILSYLGAGLGAYNTYNSMRPMPTGVSRTPPSVSSLLQRSAPAQTTQVDVNLLRQFK